MQQYGSKYFARRPPPPTLGRNSTFSDHGHVAYQIKENQECSNMVANIARRPPPPDPGDGISRSNSTFSDMVMLHIKLKRITNAATW